MAAKKAKFAPAPSRPSLSATLGWAMVSIPVSLYTGTEDVSIKRSLFCPNGNKAGQVWVDSVTGDSITYGQLVKKFQDADGSWVDLSDDEVQAVLSLEGGKADIEGFRPLSEFQNGEYVYDSVMQVRPGKTGTGKNKRVQPATEKAFALLLASMEAEKVFALVKFVNRGRTKYGALLPNGYMHVLLFDENVRESLPLPEVEFSEAEVTMGRKLVKQAISKTKRPALVNNDVEKVMEYVDQKKAGKVTEPEKVETAGETDDLMAALTASLG